MRIRDRNISPKDYGAFGKCSVLHKGRMIRFTMAGGTIYDVPLVYFLQWHDEPHYVYSKGRWVAYRGLAGQARIRLDAAFTKCRRVMGGRAVRVYLGKCAYFVPWDTVLMACERDYEHFGGLTKESRRATFAYHREKAKRGRRPSESEA